MVQARKKRRPPVAELPAFIAPQLAYLADSPPAGEEWLYEIKYDGYRVLARIDARDVRLFTRSGKDWTAKLPRLAAAVAKLGLKRAWLDGEIAVEGERGISSFQALQNAFQSGADAGVRYFVFDLPFAGGRDLRQVPLVERKRELAALIGGKSDLVRFSDHLDSEAEDALAHACRMGLEGLIGKRADATYVSGRTRTWIKLKCRPRQEFVIGGYTDPAGSRQGLGALLVGLHDESGSLRYAGRVGTGFDQKLLGELARTLHGMRRDEPPFADASRLPRAALRGVHWVRPELVAEVAYAGWTDDRVLRQASLVALRADKPAGEVRAERTVRIASPAAAGGLVKVAGVAISHPERAIWRDEGITKADLARYYEAVAPQLLPHLRARPLSLLRCPGGTAAQCFFQKHMGDAPPAGVKTFVWERASKDKDERYVYLDTVEALIGVVQRGSVELHTWGSTVPRVEKPDRITIDLDPDPALAWSAMADAARLVRALFEEVELASFLKTTGGKGLHVVVPLARRHGWGEVKSFARAVAEHLARTFPDRFTAKAGKERRDGEDLRRLSAQRRERNRGGRLLGAGAGRRAGFAADRLGGARERRARRVLQPAQRAGAAGAAGGGPLAGLLAHRGTAHAPDAPRSGRVSRGYFFGRLVPPVLRFHVAAQLRTTSSSNRYLPTSVAAIAITMRPTALRSASTASPRLITLSAASHSAATTSSMAIRTNAPLIGSAPTPTRKRRDWGR